MEYWRETDESDPAALSLELAIMGANKTRCHTSLLLFLGLRGGLFAIRDIPGS